MKYIDVFNGDADGICALHQLRLANPVESTLVTGVKRDISLLKQVKAEEGDRVTVLDISLDKNRDDLVRVLGEEHPTTINVLSELGGLAAARGLQYAPIKNLKISPNAQIGLSTAEGADPEPKVFVNAEFKF